MTGDRIPAILVATCLVLSLSCGGDSAGPGSGNVTASATDPTGDQFGTDSVQPDLVKVTVTRDTGGVTVVLDLAAPAMSLFTDTIHGVGGYLDLDTDQDSTTGIDTWTDVFRATGSTGMKEEFYLDFVDLAVDSTAFVYDTAFNQTGSVRPAFSGNHVTFRIPKLLLHNDDGFVNVAVVVGNNLEPTDLAPNTGHIKVGGAGPVAPYQPSAGLRPLVRRHWGTH